MYRILVRKPQLFILGIPTETRKIPKLKTRPKLQSQYKEYNPSSLCVVPSSNDTYYTTLMGLKLTKY